MWLIKPKASSLVVTELFEAERQLLRASIAQQKAVANITAAEADLIVKNADLSYYQGLVRSLKEMRDTPSN